METVADFIFLVSKITVDGDWSHEIRRRLLLGRKALTNLDTILKSRGITLLTKVYLVKAMVFHVCMYIYIPVMFGCESWTIEKAECQRIDAFQLWWWRRLLRVPWTVRSSQSILKDVNPEYSLEGLMLKLELPDGKSWLIGKDPDAGKDGRQEENGVIEDEMVGWHHWLNRHDFEQTPGDRKDGILVCCSPWGLPESDMTEWLNHNNKCQNSQIILLLLFFPE